MPFEWDSKFETGEDRIDRQHKQLFGYADQLEAMMMRARAGSPIQQREVDDLMDFLATYIDVHFAYEEVCMAVRRCPFAAKNRDAHNKLIEFYGEFQQDVSNNGATLEKLETLHGFLGKWLVGHICGIDTHLNDPPKPVRGLGRRAH